MALLYWNFLQTEVSQKLTVLIAATISLWRFLMGFASYVANPIKYTPTCLSTPTKTGKLQFTNITMQKGKNMNKKYLLVGFLVLFLGAAHPVVAVTETQIALTTEATNDAIVNLEAALKAVTENKIGRAHV